MKKIISILFLTIYLSAIFNSILPYVDYLINYDYISTVLCINKDKPKLNCKGKCHLKNQVKLSIEKQAPLSNKENHILTSNDFDPAIIEKLNDNIDYTFENQNNINIYSIVFYSKDIYHDIFQPPEFV